MQTFFRHEAMLVSVSVFRNFRENQDMLGKLIEAGMNCARLNFSHGDHGAQGKVVARLRKVMQKSPPAVLMTPLARVEGRERNDPTSRSVIFFLSARFGKMCFY